MRHPGFMMWEFAGNNRCWWLLESSFLLSLRTISTLLLCLIIPNCLNACNKSSLGCILNPNLTSFFNWSTSRSCAIARGVSWDEAKILLNTLFSLISPIFLVHSILFVFSFIFATNLTIAGWLFFFRALSLLTNLALWISLQLLGAYTFLEVLDSLLWQESSNSCCSFTTSNFRNLQLPFLLSIIFSKPQLGLRDPLLVGSL